MPSPSYGHWDVGLVGRFDPDNHLGFVYQITHKKSGKSYIGCKHLWKFRKRKKVRASEWRYYCSSSKYLVPEIKKLGKRAFKFEILLLCPNKRDLYYNETKIQMELGVLESDKYYNANVGGIRFYRPVKSYITVTLRGRFKGTCNPAYRGPFSITYKNGSVERVEDKTLKEWCSENKYTQQRLSDIRRGRISSYKDITAMEYDDERE
tara:strand:+ start:104 stop:724 length:621 start_codon:yes stop_codon:yes gene_type:complete